MNADMVKNVTSSLIALFAVGYGMWQLVELIKAGAISGDAGLGILSLVIGGAVTWSFTREQSTQTARATERAMSLGANTAQPQPTITTTAGPPQTTTVTPSPPEDR